jgi:N-acetylmuramic acid 6-phosphate etherase
VPRSEGRSLLEQSGGSVKLALLMASRELGVEEARQHLDHCDGQLRRALTEQL